MSEATRNASENLGERFIPTVSGWSDDKKRMFYSNYKWASQYATNGIILDCACGSGYGSDILSCNGAFVVGADVEPDIIEYASTNYNNENIRFEVFSATQIPYPDGFFDTVVSFDTIEHVSNDEAMIMEIKRVTKPAGTIILSTPLHHYTKMPDRDDLFDPTHVREYSAYQWLHLLSLHFNKAEFFIRDRNFEFREFSPEEYNGAAGDFSFVKLTNIGGTCDTNINIFKHKVAMHLSYLLREREETIRRYSKANSTNNQNYKNEINRWSFFRLFRKNH